MPSRATKSAQYFAIAEFYGNQLLQQIGNQNIPDFVLAEYARRAAHFASMAKRMRQPGDRRTAGPPVTPPPRHQSAVCTSLAG